MVPQSFEPAIIDEVLTVEDAASIAAIRVLREQTGHWAGGSTGTNLIGAWRLASAMRERGEEGSVVTLMCDGGARYVDTYYSDSWLEAEGIDIRSHQAEIEAFLTDERPQ